MDQRADVAILGGGVIGLTTAFYLAEEGASVVVLDQGDLGKAASWAGAGIVPPANLAHAHTAYDQLRAHSAALYPDLSRTLRQLTNIDNEYVVCGGLELPLSADDRLPTEEWASEGIPVQEVSGPDLRRLAPDLAPDLPRAVHIPGMAQVRNPRHLQALIEACRKRGVDLRPHCPARSLDRAGARIAAVVTEAGRLAADRFLIAAGAWSDELLAPLGWRPGIRPVRGQIALLDTGTPGARPLLLQGKRYLVPRLDGRLLVGSTEEDAGFDARPTAGGVADLLALAVRLVPSLAGATLERSWAGLRPGSPDGLPYLGRIPDLDNVFVGAGHFRAGLQLSPASGRVLADLLLGRPPLVPVEDFRLDR